MKKFIGIVLAGMVLGGCSFVNVPQTEDSDNAIPSRLITVYNDSNMQDVASAIEPAIVGVSGIYSKGESIGSGVCVGEGGYILTNSHVVNGASSVVLHLSNKNSAKATIIYDNPVLDLAILKSSTSLPYLAIGNSDKLSVGQDVMAVGTPLSLTLTHTFTKGIVSALNRTLKVDSTSGEGYMQNLIQHDASLNPGNSGGPLVNSSGEVVGINTLKITSGEGIGFAIPSKSFESLIGSFVENINYQIPYLGVYGYDSEIANYHDKSISEKGFYVIDVSPSSPLSACGVKPNSVIKSFNGKKINNTLDLKDELYKLSVGDVVYLEFEYNGALFKAKTKLNKIDY